MSRAKKRFQAPRPLSRLRNKRYVSVALSGAANIYFSRRVEIEQGVTVCSLDGTELGVSQEAAKQGILQTVRCAVDALR